MSMSVCLRVGGERLVSVTLQALLRVVGNTPARVHECLAMDE